jgi:CRISPR-associated protein Csb2
VVIVPLSSIGHHHADMLIRRIAIEIAPSCPIAKADVLWAFSGLKILPTESSVVLFSAEDTEMLEHYGAGKKASVWRTITPVALPANAARRRIDPDRDSRIPKGASEKTREQAIAIAAVIQALRHAGIQRYGAVITRIQKEPFQSQGKKAQDFAPRTRFAKERLWHVEIEFPDEIEGPLFIGDGRFSGLGVFAPCHAAAL